MSAIDKIIGYQDIKDELEDMLYITDNPELFRKEGLTIPRGLLINGPEGLGKCFMAEQFMAESSRKIFRIDSPDLTEDDFGAFRDFVEHMEPDGKYLLFIKSFDAIAEGNDYLLKMLRVMRKETHEYDVFFLGTTERPLEVPPDFLKEDFFEKSINIDTPNQDDGKLMIQQILTDLHITPDISVDDIYGMMMDASYRDIKELLSDAALSMKLDRLRFQGDETPIQKRRHSKLMPEKASEYVISPSDVAIPSFTHFLINSWNMKEYYRTDYYRSVDEDEIRKAAYHEAGHVIVGELLQPGVMGFASVRKTGNSSIYGITLDEGGINNLKIKVMISLGGRAATKVMLDNSTDESTDDFKRALHIIRHLVTERGSDGIRYVSSYNDDELSSSAFRKSQEAAINRIAEEYMIQTEKLIRNNKAFLVQVANRLIRNGYILKSEIGALREENRK